MPIHLHVRTVLSDNVLVCVYCKGIIIIIGLYLTKAVLSTKVNA